MKKLLIKIAVSVAAIISLSSCGFNQYLTFNAN